MCSKNQGMLCVVRIARLMYDVLGCLATYAIVTRRRHHHTRLNCTSVNASSVFTSSVPHYSDTGIIAQFCISRTWLLHWHINDNKIITRMKYVICIQTVRVRLTCLHTLCQTAPLDVPSIIVFTNGVHIHHSCHFHWRWHQNWAGRQNQEHLWGSDCANQPVLHLRSGISSADKSQSLFFSNLVHWSPDTTVWLTSSRKVFGGKLQRCGK